MIERPQTQKEEEYNVRADIADGYRESIEMDSEPYESTVHFDKNGLVIPDPLGLGFENDFTVCLFGPDGDCSIRTIEDMYKQLAKIQEEHDDLMISVSTDNKRRNLTYKVSLKSRSN